MIIGYDFSVNICRLAAAHSFAKVVREV